MILVLEKNPAHPAKVAARVVLEDGEVGITLLEVRVMLRKALEDLPSAVEGLTVCPFPQRRKDDRRTA